jgi:hypothetical protein
LSLPFPDRILSAILALGIHPIIFIHNMNILSTIDAAWFIVTSIVQLPLLPKHCRGSTGQQVALFARTAP